MKLIKIKNLKLEGVKVFIFERFTDHRGYFTETYRKSDIEKELNLKIVQINESFSKEKVLRGLHFQWNPYMGKLVRTIQGHMIDLILDIRKGSPTFGKAIAYDMPVKSEDKLNEWIWIPPGFAHGNIFLRETIIEYLCNGEYSQGFEAGISPLAPDIDWSLCKEESAFDLAKTIVDPIISEKDKAGLTLTEWAKKEESNNFIYNELV